MCQQPCGKRPLWTCPGELSLFPDSETFEVLCMQAAAGCSPEQARLQLDEHPKLHRAALVEEELQELLGQATLIHPLHTGSRTGWAGASTSIPTSPTSTPCSEAN